MVSIEPAGDLGGHSMKDYSTMSKHVRFVQDVDVANSGT